MGLFDFLKRNKAKVNILVDKRLLNSFDLTEDKLEIGRSPEEIPGLILKLPGRILIATQANTKTVSRKHATLEWDPLIKKYRLKDHSTYGTVLNGKDFRNNAVGEIVEQGSNMFITPFTFQVFY